MRLRDQLIWCTLPTDRWRKVCLKSAIWIAIIWFFCGWLAGVGALFIYLAGYLGYMIGVSATKFYIFEFFEVKRHKSDPCPKCGFNAIVMEPSDEHCPLYPSCDGQMMKKP